MTHWKAILKNNWKLQHAIFLFLLAVLFILIGIHSLYYDKQIDITQNKRNSLSQVSKTIVDKIDSELKILAFVRGNPKVKNLVVDLLGKYQRQNKNISLEFKNPDTEIDLVKKYQITTDGEMYLTYKGHGSHVADLSEASITRAIQTLEHINTESISFLIGHGERGNGKANYQYGFLFKQLLKQGLAVNEQNINIAKVIADNTDLLVIADPQTDFNAQEKQAIKSYINKGKNILILAGKDSAKLDFITQPIGVKISPSVILNDSAARYGVDNKRFLAYEPISKYPVFADLKSILLFPEAVSLQFKEKNQDDTSSANAKAKANNKAKSDITTNKQAIKKTDTNKTPDWDILPLLYTTEPSVLQNPDNSLSKPDNNKIYYYGIEVSRLISDKRQRIFIIGNSDFMSNQYIGNGQNLIFSLNLLSFLATPDFKIVLDKHKQQVVVINEDKLSILGGILLFAFPLFLIVFGWFFTRKQRAMR